MRSLRSARKVNTPGTAKSAKVVQDENLGKKMCSRKPNTKKSEPGKNARQALADKTNSGSENTSTSSSSCNVSNNVKTRPKRTHNIPAKYVDHELSPILTKKHLNPEFSSTPLPSKEISSLNSRNGTPKRNNITPILEHSPKIKINSTPVKETRSKRLLNKKVVAEVPQTATTAKDIKLTKSKKTLQNPTIEEVPSQTNGSSDIRTDCIKENCHVDIKSKSLNNNQIIKSKDKTNIDCDVSISHLSPNKIAHSENPVQKVMTPIYKKKFTLLEKPKIQTPDRLALYDFDFDPSEEPAKPIKKKVAKKGGTKKKKKKTVSSESSSDDAALQNLMLQLKKVREKQKIKKLLMKKKAKIDQGLPTKTNTAASLQSVNIPTPGPTILPSEPPTTSNNKISQQNETISVEHPHTQMLSPIPMIRKSCSRPPSPFEEVQNHIETQRRESVHSNVTDPADQSYFTDLPAANSSMIASARKRIASPWRVNYEVDHKKWPRNFYVKPSMTPAYDRDTFHVIGLDDKPENSYEQTKHVYTNISLPDKSSESQKNWKQTSILSFYEESFKKAAKKRSYSPCKSKEPYNFDEYLSADDPVQSSVEEVAPTPEKEPPAISAEPILENCFGFDDSTEYDQENISPVKIPKLNNINTLRGGSKAVRKRAGILKEINIPMERNLPTRVSTTELINVIAKHKEAIAEDDPVEVENEIEPMPEARNNESDDSKDDEQEVSASTSMEKTFEPSRESGGGLFEELVEPELVHFSKPSRKSYERKKKAQVTFQQYQEHNNRESDESDYMSDSTEIIKEKVRKIAKKKRKQTAKHKKEEKAVDEWAAGFNSMLEEVDEFPLCIE